MDGSDGKVVIEVKVDDRGRGVGDEADSDTGGTDWQGGDNVLGELLDDAPVAVRGTRSVKDKGQVNLTVLVNNYNKIIVKIMFLKTLNISKSRS